MIKIFTRYPCLIVKNNKYCSGMKARRKMMSHKKVYKKTYESRNLQSVIKNIFIKITIPINFN